MAGSALKRLMAEYKRKFIILIFFKSFFFFFFFFCIHNPFKIGVESTFIKIINIQVPYCYSTEFLMAEYIHNFICKSMFLCFFCYNYIDLILIK